jgi:glycosyltransferase involved in cell wall biosynthesis
MPTPSPISIVVTCFNLERYISEAIESVFVQRDAEPFEIIVVDDCSTDASAEIIRKFDRVKYVRTPTNGGVLLAMLSGIAVAQHDLICLLDGDDLWDEGKLAATRAAFDADPRLALVTHDLQFIGRDSRPLERRSRPNEVLTPLDSSTAADRVRRGILEIGDYVWLGSALSFRRSLARWDEFVEFATKLADPRNCYQDWPLAYWIAALRDVHLAYIAEPLFRYRLHGENHSADARTVDRALRNYTRTYNTCEAMAAIADRRSLSNTLKRLARQRAAFAKAHVDLYAGRRLRALAGFLRTIPLIWRDGLLAKEIARFSTGLLLGTSALIRLSARGGSKAPGT